MVTAFHQRHHIRPLDCPSNNRAATMGKNDRQQPSKRRFSAVRRQRSILPPSATAEEFYFHLPLCQQRHNIATPASATTTTNTTVDFGYIPPAAASTESEPSQPTPRYIIFIHPPRPRVLIILILPIHSSANRGIIFPSPPPPRPPSTHPSILAVSLQQPNRARAIHPNQRRTQ
mmetsp:Transcript_38500/g.70632  ORF Transcript_38500/g.70632 Transcript_38500/m.70632 type:complete len:174 (-) Transcript_38500:340-861(-)